MKKIFLGLILLFYTLSLPAFGQVYGEKKLFKSFDKWIVSSNGDELSMKSFVTIQEILIHDDYDVRSRTINNLPRYRFEVYLISTSTYQGESSKIYVYSTKVFINGVEATKRQFPNGFDFFVDTKPTLVYWYETDVNSIDVRIKWSDVTFFIK